MTSENDDLFAMSDDLTNGIDAEKTSFSLPERDVAWSFPFLPEQVDMLVDGELDEQERIALFAQFDAVDDGWKQCALAFLESQMFSQALKKSLEVNHPLVQPQTSLPPIISYPNHQRRSTKSIPVWMFISLCCAITFLVSGLLFSALKFNDTTTDSPKIAKSDPVQPNIIYPDTPPGINVDHPRTPPLYVNIPQTEMKNFVSDPPMVHVLPRAMPGHVPNTEYVSFSIGGNGANNTTTIPCYSGNDIDVASYLNAPSSISPQQLKIIQQSGGDIDVDRQNIIMSAGDGRKIIIPIDQIHVQYHPQIKFL